jgi:hypothetical protein
VWPVAGWGLKLKAKRACFKIYIPKISLKNFNAEKIFES